jgi:RNA-directed DNA polymerase
MRAKLKKIKAELRQRLHQPIPERGPWLVQIVQGFLLPRRADEHAGIACFPAHHRASLAAHATEKYRFAWDLITKLFRDFLPKPRLFIPGRSSALPSGTQGQNRMP